MTMTMLAAARCFSFGAAPASPSPHRPRLLRPFPTRTHAQAIVKTETTAVPMRTAVLTNSTTNILSAAVEFSFDDADDGDGEDLICYSSTTCMAVPKKRTSRTKKRIRRSAWMKKGAVAAKKAFALGKSLSTGESKSFFVKQTTTDPDTNTNPK